MTRRKLHLVVLAGVLLLALASSGQARAGVVVKAPVIVRLAPSPPSEPCDFQHRMDLAIVNGVWYECSCEALMVGTVCDWYEILTPAPEFRRRAKLVKRIRGGLLVRVARPVAVHA